MLVIDQDHHHPAAMVVLVPVALSLVALVVLLVVAQLAVQLDITTDPLGRHQMASPSEDFLISVMTLFLVPELFLSPVKPSLSLLEESPLASLEENEILVFCVRAFDISFVGTSGLASPV